MRRGSGGLFGTRAVFHVARARICGEMNYLRDERRVDPRLALDGARSVIVVALNYNAPQPYSIEHAGVHDDDSPRGWISRYAWGDDYHEVLREKLNALVARMHAQWPEPFDARAYVDTGPVVERVAANMRGSVGSRKIPA